MKDARVTADDALLEELRELRERDERNRALLDAMPDLMFRFDRNGTYLEARAASDDDLPVPPPDLIGLTVFDTLAPELAERFLALVPVVLSERRLEVVEYDFQFHDEVRSYEARITPSGEDEVLAIVRDVTDRKRASGELLRLHGELQQRLDELQASRARIVEAGDAERRRLERDLHDGAQQRLLGARLTLRLARDRMDAGDAEEAGTLLGEVDEELQGTVEDLRSLAHGIHPALLTDRGLAPALDVLARRAPVPVEVDAKRGGRVAAPIEAALYFVVCEALANVAKHAEASRVRVTFERTASRATVEIADDGNGAADATCGTGLRGLRDRVEALGGVLSVVSAPGRGTTVRAEVPCA